MVTLRKSVVAGVCALSFAVAGAAVLPVLAAAAVAAEPTAAAAQGHRRHLAVAAGQFEDPRRRAGAAGRAGRDAQVLPACSVFAPTDEAFAKLPAGTVEDLLKPENKDKLVSILTYHAGQGYEQGRRR